MLGLGGRFGSRNDSLHPRVLIRLMTCLTHDRKITYVHTRTIPGFIRVLKRILSVDKLSSHLVPSVYASRPGNAAGPRHFLCVPKIKKYSRSRSQTVDEDAAEPKDDDEAPEDEPELELTEKIDWATLSLDQKLDILHNLCEWQFTNPTRIRSNMKQDDEFASWVCFWLS